jgi:hypothetical protein
MKEKSKWLFVFLLCAFSSTVVDAQTLESYAHMTTIPWFRVWANPPRLTHAQEVMQDNELVRHEIGQDANFHTNLLQINGKALDYNIFDMSTKGVLTVVKGDPDSKGAQPIPFYVSIRRNGKILEDKKMSFLNKTLYKINLSEIFSFSEHGDVLIVNPVRAADWKAKRLLKLLGGC